MGTEFHATAAVNADEGFAGRVQVDGIDRAGLSTGFAANAQLFPDDHATPFPLRIRPGWASNGTRRRIAGQTGLSLEAGRKTARRLNPDSCLIPGKLLVHQTGAGYGTGVTTNASFHAWRAQNFQDYLLSQEQ
jgi:hypothetical protein